MGFVIGEKIRVISTKERGTITDKMYSEGKQTNVYVVKPDDGGRSFMRKEAELEAVFAEKNYSIDMQIADGVVICVIYEISDNKKTEVCRGHGHIIHEGVEGIAQACSYASRKALQSVDSGIYFKQNTER